MTAQISEVIRFRGQELAMCSHPFGQFVALGGESPEFEAPNTALWRGYVYFRPEQGKMPQNYRMTHTDLPVGLTVYRARNVVISNFVMQKFPLSKARPGPWNGSDLWGSASILIAAMRIASVSATKRYCSLLE